MLDEFPNEIVEMVINYLPILELIRTSQLNRRLHSIVHRDRSPIKRRYERKMFAKIELRQAWNFDTDMIHNQVGEIIRFSFQLKI